MVSRGGHLTGMGKAVPGELDQDVLWNEFFAGHFTGSPVARRVFRAAEVRHRHAVVSPLLEDAPGHYGVALAFGPGLTLYAVLLQG
jgi:hypothetical protein